MGDNIQLQIGREIELDSAQIRPTNACQLDCIGCWYYGKDSVGKPPSWKANSLDLDTFSILIKDLEQIGFRKLVIAGGGDPLAHPQIYEMLEMAAKRFEIRLLTNLLLCRDPNRLAQTGIKEIIVNTSAARTETFLDFHPNLKPQFSPKNDPFRKLQNLILEIKKQINVKLNFVIGKINQNEIFDILTLGSELNVAVTFKNLRDPKWGLNAEERSAVEKLLPSLKEQAHRLEITTNLDSYSPWSDFLPIENQRCYAGFFTTVIEANGDVCYCCMPGADAHPIGNLHQERFIEIWQSPAYNEFRRKFFEKRFEPFCDGCVYFDRNRDFNNKIKNKLTPSFFNQMESGL